MIHELKTYSEYFKAVISGEKPFEIRKNDRNFKVGDYIALRLDTGRLRKVCGKDNASRTLTPK